MIICKLFCTFLVLLMEKDLFGYINADFDTFRGSHRKNMVSLEFHRRDLVTRFCHCICLFTIATKRFKKQSKNLVSQK